MKTNSTIQSFIRGAVLIGALFVTAAVHAGEKVGVYDSRLVAYAHFWKPERQAQLKQLIADGKAAKAAHDDARFREINQRLTADQNRMHLQVFSTAPIPELMATLEARVGEIQRDTGVSRVVSKWDEAALGGVAAADRLDVTEQLVRDCPLDEKQRKTMAEIGRKEPLPLAQAEELAKAGKL